MRATHRAVLLAGVLLLAVSAGTAAADGVRFMITPGGGVAFLPDALQVDSTTRPHGGGILTALFSPGFAVEARGNYMTANGTSSTSNVKLYHGEMNFSWFLFDEAMIRPYVTAGAGLAHTRLANEPALNAGAGLLYNITPQIGLRGDARAITYHVADNTGADKWRRHVELFAGVAFGFGGKPKDTDHDLVPDKVDQCPGTPLGCVVDVHGCPIDSDKDGVCDGLDKCPNTPKGCAVDAQGCPFDADKDGICDELDQCPNTPKACKVDAHGCPIDTDGDGVCDALDKCPDTPKGCVVDAGGCPIDSDHDGVCDGLDKCPDTPPGAKVDRYGCPISEQEQKFVETGMIRLEGVKFQTGKALLDPASTGVLDEAGKTLAKYPELKVEIGGHTDSQGNAAKNMKLSEERAKAVRDYLLNKFPALHAENLTAVGYGQTKPIADNKTAEGRAQNRRVEFKVLNPEALKQ